MAKFFTPSRLSENIVETPEGFLLCMSVPVARTGWQDYGPGETPLEVGNDGKVWVYRDASEVFRPQTMASFNGKSITIKHPEDFVVPANWKDLTHGTAQNVRKGTEVDEDGEEMLLADLLITDELAIGLVRNGLREVSCGYDAEYEQTGDGEGKQLNIIGNHIALVEQGRAGPTYAIKDHKTKGEEMKTLKELAEQLKNLGKTVDAAVAAEDKKAADLAKAKKKTKTGDDEGGKTPEQVTYDDLVKKMADMNDKLDGMMGSKKSDDEDEEDKPKKSDDEEMDDSDEDDEVGQNGRLDKLEAAIAKILKVLGNKKADDEESEEDGDEDMSGDEDMEESEDEDMEETDDEDCEDEEGEEAEESQKKKTGDEAKFEILTPGKKFKGKDARSKCLKEFAKSDEGMKVLKQLGHKKPVFDAKTNVDMLFMAASALVKSKRGTGLGGTKDSTKWKDEDVDNTASEGKTAEELNEINAKHYGVAK
jgi:hypothetical protein